LPPKEPYQQDIQEIIDFSMSRLNSELPVKQQYEFKRLLNGYKQFDPTRGSAYLLDLILFDRRHQVNVHKRVNLMRPLGHVELMPMAYVTESQQINLIVTFTDDLTGEDIVKFFSSYERFVLDLKEVAEKLKLYVVYVVNNAENQNTTHTTWTFIGDRITELTRRYSSLLKTSTQIEKMRLPLDQAASDGYRQLAVIEHVSPNVSIDGLILMASACVELKSEFLNRVRLNTIKNSQVFFPIPFSEYMPSIVYPAANRTTTSPDEIEINKFYGYFNTYTFDFVSFYNSDYMFTRASYLQKRIEGLGQLKSGSQINAHLENYLDDVYELFRTNENIHILRATDQALKCRWHLQASCESEKRSEDERNRCRRQLETGFGTKAQLAVHLMKNFDKISKKANAN
jgi:hypothetical protein